MQNINTLYTMKDKDIINALNVLLYDIGHILV